jgi:hypothetical protein
MITGSVRMRPYMAGLRTEPVIMAGFATRSPGQRPRRLVSMVSIDERPTSPTGA